MHDWVNSSRFLVKTGETGLTGNIYTGLHEFPDMAFLLHFLRREDLFVDVGANVGSYTILACSAVGASGLAFEPVPVTYKRLLENMRLNELEGKVVCLCNGVGSHQATMNFTIDGDTTNHALASGEQSKNTTKVEVTSLDTVLKNKVPALLKIDVEGYETPVLDGAEETLKKQSLKSVIMELNGSGSRYGFDEHRILEIMNGYEFTPCSYNPMDRTLTNLGGKNPQSGNTLFVRDKLFVEDRLKSSSKFSIHGIEI